MSVRLKQRPAHGSGRRLLDWFRIRVLGAAGKRQRLYFVSINGHRYKRVVFGDSFQAAAVVSALEACRSAVHLPELILHHENELWLQFVDGRRPDPRCSADWEALADFFAALYRLDSRQIKLDEGAMPARLQADLEFLLRSGILGTARFDTLKRLAERLKPESLWVGMDYLDPVLKNFVVSGEDLFVVDVESLAQESPLGTGVVKCFLHWLGADRRDFLERVVCQPGVPDFRAQLGYVELCFLAAWTKRKLLTGKQSRIRVECFDQIRQSHEDPL